MRFGFIALMVVGVTVSLLALIWWVRFHRVPTIRISFTVGKGFAVDVDWIDLRPAPAQLSDM